MSKTFRRDPDETKASGVYRIARRAAKTRRAARRAKTLED